MSECCVKGFGWRGTPTGEETSYVTGPESEAAILVIHDLFWWTFSNTRLLADEYARNIHAKAHMPDFFGGEVLSAEILKGRSTWGKLDIEGFISRQTKTIREPEIMQFAKTLRSGHKHVGVIGFCFGGWAVFRLGSQENEHLVDCISTAHPTWLEKCEVERVAVPVQIMAPEFGTEFTVGLRDFSNKVIPTLGVVYDYQYFPGVEHAFATRGNQASEAEMSAMVRAKDCAVSWFRQWLRPA